MKATTFLLGAAMAAFVPSAVQADVRISGIATPFLMKYAVCAYAEQSDPPAQACKGQDKALRAAAEPLIRRYVGPSEAKATLRDWSRVVSLMNEQAETFRSEGRAVDPRVLTWLECAADGTIDGLVEDFQVDLRLVDDACEPFALRSLREDGENVPKLTERRFQAVEFTRARSVRPYAITKSHYLGPWMTSNSASRRGHTYTSFDRGAFRN
ncbi:hypothetical protein B5C34_03430 [Pacificimonas flava]|uniref:Uncharacterized protein n=2 Tax=Pacificimonas TaxID=1960290 RepID=A0A219B378_9SPHN|nr:MULTISPECIES: hypothetical protein [Pacificimonas]MBZ6377729.1 hypothetical protein [Pacificimonas aurantium]OWV32593.1 hypothetical protein B5C34_03430 [Pacificimonas flava]